MNKLMSYIETERKKQRVLVVDLASDLGITPQSYYKWRRGEGNPKLSNIRKISEILNIPFNDLMKLEAGEDIQTEPETKKAATPGDDGKEESQLIKIARQLEQVSLRIALYGDAAEDVTDDDLEAIREYARFIRSKRK